MALSDADVQKQVRKIYNCFGIFITSHFRRLQKYLIPIPFRYHATYDTMLIKSLLPNIRLEQNSSSIKAQLPSTNSFEVDLFNSLSP